MNWRYTLKLTLIILVLSYMIMKLQKKDIPDFDVWLWMAANVIAGVFIADFI